MLRLMFLALLSPAILAEPAFANRVQGFLADPTVLFLLFVLATTCLYIELAHPGAIVPGVIGALALILFLFSAGSIQPNWAGLALMLLAIVLLAIDVRAPTHGFLTVSALVSLVIGAVIVWGTWGLLRESINLSMDAVPAGIDPHSVENYLANLEGVTAVHDLHIWAMSTTEVALTVHLVMEQAPRNDLFLHNVNDSLRDRFGIGHATTQIECGSGERDCRQAPVHVV